MGQVNKISAVKIKRTDLIHYSYESSLVSSSARNKVNREHYNHTSTLVHLKRIIKEHEKKPRYMYEIYVLTRLCI